MTGSGSSAEASYCSDVNEAWVSAHSASDLRAGGKAATILAAGWRRRTARTAGNRSLSADTTRAVSKRRFAASSVMATRDTDVGLLLLVAHPRGSAVPALVVLLLEPAPFDRHHRAMRSERVPELLLPAKCLRIVSHGGGEVANRLQVLTGVQEADAERLEINLRPPARRPFGSPKGRSSFSCYIAAARGNAESPPRLPRHQVAQAHGRPRRRVGQLLAFLPAIRRYVREHDSRIMLLPVPTLSNATNVHRPHGFIGRIAESRGVSVQEVRRDAMSAIRDWERRHAGGVRAVHRPPWVELMDLVVSRAGPGPPVAVRAVAEPAPSGERVWPGRSSPRRGGEA